MSILDFNGSAWGIPAGGLHSASYCPPIVPAPAGTEPNPPADPLRRHNQVIPEAAVEAAARFIWQGPLDVHREQVMRAALEAAAPHINEPTLGVAVTIERAIEQIDAGEQSVPSNYTMNTGLSDAALWSEVREWLESIAGDSK